MKTLFKLLSVVTLLLLGYGFCQAMYIAPREATMGDVQRIFYYHLPSAWIAFLLFFVNFLASSLVSVPPQHRRRCACPGFG